MYIGRKITLAMRHLKMLLFVHLGFLMLNGSCPQKSSQLESVDAIMVNGNVYTVDSNFSVKQAIAIRHGKIIAVGSTTEIKSNYTSTNVIDLNDAFVYPGFIDAHCHFYGYGKNSTELDLRSTKSLDDLVQKVKTYNEVKHRDWLIGRGWNEETWSGSKTVNNAELNRLFPNQAVVLQRVDGHSVLANQEALDRAGISKTSVFKGGEVVLSNGKMTGVLVDNAANKLLGLVPLKTDDQIKGALLKAQKDCFAYGLTTVADAGLDLDILKILNTLTGEELKIRMYAMSNPSEEAFQYFKQKGKIDKPRLKVRSFKLYGDGSLGSRSAWLKNPYCGEPENFGLPQSDTGYFRRVCEMAKSINFQLNTHCIGDSANTIFLNMYGAIIGSTPNHRWRIEHAQIVDTNDMHLFEKYNIIPSVQPTHAISDMFMAPDRLCGNLEGAYAYKSLLGHAGIIAFGTDFPVEGIDPLATFNTAVYRKGGEGQEFQAQEAMSREDALRAMTIWAAYACFMENEVGSIEARKMADFTILDKDIIKTNQVQNAKVLATFVNGEQVFVSQ
jgi:predicted amidohydrolase YtcJ